MKQFHKWPVEPRCLSKAYKRDLRCIFSSNHSKEEAPHEMIHTASFKMLHLPAYTTVLFSQLANSSLHI